MILLDYSQVIFSQVHYELARNKTGTVSIDLLRHFVMNKIGEYNNKFKNKYGQMVICIDSRDGYWRKKAFQYYKWKRAKNRDDSDLDWKELFRCMNEIREEMIEKLPLMTYEVKYYEADDLISALCREFRDEKHIIVSSDGDFAQLQKYSNVDQWSPTTKKFIKCQDPDFYRFDHIIRGDSGDGIPNIHSPIDFFPRKEEGEFKRQPSVYADKVSEMFIRYNQGVRLESMLTESQYARFEENRRLIDLVDPSDDDLYSHSTLIEEFYRQVDSHRGRRYNLYSFMVKNRMSLLLEDIQNFQNKNEFPKRPEEREGLEKFFE